MDLGNLLPSLFPVLLVHIKPQKHIWNVEETVTCVLLQKGLRKKGKRKVISRNREAGSPGHFQFLGTPWKCKYLTPQNFWACWSFHGNTLHVLPGWLRLVLQCLLKWNCLRDRLLRETFLGSLPRWASPAPALYSLELITLESSLCLPSSTCCKCTEHVSHIYDYILCLSRCSAHSRGSVNICWENAD